MTEVFIRVHYTGYTTGTHLGRDDGHPVKRFKDYTLTDEGLISFASEWGTRYQEWCQMVTRETRQLTIDEIAAYIASGLQRRKLVAENSERERDEAEYERLRKKLGK